MASTLLSPPSSGGRSLRLLALALLAAATALSGRAFAEEAVPPEFKAIQLEDHLGKNIPLDVRFTDSTGKSVAIGDYFDKTDPRPLILIPVYYNCPMLCPYTLNGFVDVLKKLKFVPGKDFNVATFSFDPSETAELAASKKDMYVKALGLPEAGAGWHFLVGDKDAIARLTDALGFRFEYDPVDKSYKHAPAVYVITPAGRISRYFSNIYFEPKDLRLSLVDASDGRIGTVVDKFVLYCCRYNPETGKYSVIASRVMTAGGVVTVIALAWMLGMQFLYERRRARKWAAEKQERDASRHGGAPHDHEHGHARA
jgi:protein SCO1/2